MKRVAIILILITAVLACKNDKKQVPDNGIEKTFSLTGTLVGVPDSSKVIISEANRPIDSTLVMNEKFSLKGPLENPINVYLSVKGTRDFTTVWLEPTEMSIIAEKGKFKKAKITGSSLQKEDDFLSSQIVPIRHQQDSIENLVTPDITKLEQQALIEAYINLEKKEDSIYRKFINDYNQSFVSADILNIYKTTWGKEVTQSLFDGFSTELKNSKYGKSISEYLNVNKEPAIGDAYVDFEMADVNGTMKKLSEVKGKLVLLEFWASWCGPCRAENPNLVKTYQAYHPKGFEIYAVSLDIDKDNWLAAINKDGLPWIHVSDLKGDENLAGLIYGVNGIPDNFLIDETGKVIARNLRGEKLNEKLSKILP